MEILGPFPLAPRHLKYLIVAVEYLKNGLRLNVLLR